MMPAASSPRPSSIAEQSIPADGTPRNVLVSIRRSPRREPGIAYGTRSPTARFHAPVTTSTTAPPVVTPAIWFFVEPGSGRKLLTTATTIPSKSTSCWAIRSTSLPASVRRSASVGASAVVSTYSLSQLSEISMASELPQQADVVLQEQAEVGDVVLEHRQTIQAGAEGEAGIALGVDAAVTKHLRMHHPGAQDLQPAPLAAAATGTAADTARDGRPDAGFGEGEVVTHDPNASFGTEERAGEILDRALQVRQADVVVDDQALNLIELRTVRGIRRIAPVDRARSDDADRRLVALHEPDLYRRCMGPQEQVVGLDVKAVHRVPRGMVRGDVERLEVVELVLHLRSEGDFVAEPRKDRLHLPQDQR